MPSTLKKPCQPVSENDALFRTGWPPKNKTSYLNPDGTPTSRTFALREKDYGELSVDVVSLTTPQQSVTKGGLHAVGKFMLYKITVKEVLKIGLSACHDPLTLSKDGVDNPAHAFIWGLDEGDETLPGLLARSAVLVNL